jgi:hypothetical protein
MQELSDDFIAAFSEKVHGWGRRRDYDPTSVLNDWARFVESCVRGYREQREYYVDELTTRDSIERAMNEPSLWKFPEMRDFTEAVLAIDARFRPLLLPDAFPRFPPEEWWARGVVKYAGPRLVSDLRTAYGVEILVGNGGEAGVVP